MLWREVGAGRVCVCRMPMAGAGAGMAIKALLPAAARHGSLRAGDVGHAVDGVLRRGSAEGREQAGARSRDARGPWPSAPGSGEPVEARSRLE